MLYYTHRQNENVSVLIDYVKLILGKPAERQGRKTKGLNSLKGYDSQLLGKQIQTTSRSVYIIWKS